MNTSFTHFLPCLLTKFCLTNIFLRQTNSYIFNSFDCWFLVKRNVSLGVLRVIMQIVNLLTNQYLNKQCNFFVMKTTVYETRILRLVNLWNITPRDISSFWLTTICFIYFVNFDDIMGPWISFGCFFKDDSSSTPSMEFRMVTHMQGSTVSNLTFQWMTVHFSVNKVIFY